MNVPTHPVGIIYDIQALQNPLHRDRGIGRYIIDHVNALIDLNAPLSALVLNPQYEVPSALPQHWYANELLRWNTPQIVRDAQRDFARVIYHIASPFEPTVPECGVAVRHALRHADVLSVMVFDTIPYLFPHIHQRTDELRRRFRLRRQLIRRADVVLTISEHTRKDAIQEFGLNPSRVVSHGTGGSEFFVPTPDHRPTSVDGPYLLTVSGWGDPRKDPHTTFRAYAKLRKADGLPHRLVVACNLPDEGRAAWLAEIHELGIAPQGVVLTGHISDSELRSLYSHADLFIMSSRYEGFGLPALEAARCGAPVITTNSSSIPEVLDFAPGTFDPGDDAALAVLVHRALNDEEFRSDLEQASRRAAQTHIWSKVAQRSLHTWDEAAKLSSRARTSTESTNTLNVALVGPFPPSKSGIGTFNARVGAALARHCNVDYFSEGDDPFPPPLPREFGWFPVQSLGRTVHHGAYDAMIYTIGNGHYHRATLAAALRNPGIVWLHDAHLAGLYLTNEGVFLPSGEATPATLERARTHMRDKVKSLYGTTPILADDDWWRSETYDRQHLTMLRELLATARALIVNTEAAADIARREAPADLAIYVLPLPYPQTRSQIHIADSAATSTFDTNTLTISTLGWVDPLKQPRDLIAAFTKTVNTTLRPLRLVFIGELSESLKNELVALTRDFGVHDQVLFTGFTSDDDYATWLEHTDIAVQLRAVTRGEASAALCDAIAHGIPTITSISTASELPTGTVKVIDSASGTDRIAQELTTLIEDDSLRIEIAAAARHHAGSWSFDALAERVLEIARFDGSGGPIANPARTSDL